MMKMLLLTLLLLLDAERAATWKVCIELWMLVVWCTSMAWLLIVSCYLILPVVIHRLHLLLEPLVLLVKQMLFIFSSYFTYINYHECRDGN